MKKVSFVIIAFNEEKNIADCINSILNQNGLNLYEIIAVDDASRDNTLPVLKRLKKTINKLKIISFKKNQGRGYARQKGVECSTGDYIAFVDGDIILPNSWLEICLKNLNKYDAVGGITVPDGDVTYIFNMFKLKPKKTAHTTELTGSNCIYKKELFRHLHFRSNYPDGEDVDINIRLKKAGAQLKSITDLTVFHCENKTFLRTLSWMWQSGIGSTRLLSQYKIMRMPDLVFFNFLFLILSLLFSCFAAFQMCRYVLLLLILFVLISSLLHLQSRFYLTKDKIFNYVLAVFVNAGLLNVYLLGRIAGIIKLLV